MQIHTFGNEMENMEPRYTLPIKYYNKYYISL